MVKNRLLMLLLFIAFSFCGCNNSVDNVASNNIESDLVLGKTKDYWENKMDEIKFEQNYPGYYYELNNDDIFNGITIGNYDTTKITPVNGLQEVVEYGNEYGNKVSKNYVQISLLDKNNDYSVNINIETGEYINEVGEYFLDNYKDKYIQEKIKMIKDIIQ